MTPIRLQLSRRKGFNLQRTSRAANGLPAAICARPRKLGNPFEVGKHGTREDCVRLHLMLMGGLVTVSFDPDCVRRQMEHRKYVAEHRQHLRGHNLACWCRGKPCHADTLLEVFNAKAPA